jgi:hypothetical protein
MIFVIVWAEGGVLEVSNVFAVVSLLQVLR